ncbi:MAG: formylglycine-generating enzyme family protein [Enhygromyxa sp.]
MSSDKGRRGAVWRGDLLEARCQGAARSDEQLIAKLLGFVDEGTTTDASSDPTQGSSSTSGVTTKAPVVPPLDPATPTLFWRATRLEITARDEKDEKDAGVGVSESTKIEFFDAADLVHETPPPRPPDAPPIVPWSHLRRALETVYRRSELVGDVDVDRVIHQIVRARPLNRVPRKPLWVRTRHLVVVLDRAERLMPFWRDQIEVYIRLRLELGSGVTHVWWDAGPPMWSSDADVLDAVSPELQAGDTVLVLGDLGHYASELLRRVWGRLGAALRRCGVSTAALVPCPADRWDFAAVGSWDLIDWGKPSKDAGHRRRNKDDDESCTVLLALLSWVGLIEPSLVREVRMLVPGADLGTEAEVWSYPGTIRHSSGLLLSEELRDQMQERLHQMMRGTDAERGLVRSVVDVVRRRHVGLSREVWIDGARALELIDPGCKWIERQELDQVIAFTREVCHSLEQRKINGPKSIDLEGWAAHALSRIKTTDWSHPQLGEHLHRTYEIVAGQAGRVKVPVRGSVGKFGSPDSLRPREWGLRVVADRLSIAEVPARGSPVATISGRSSWIALDRDAYRIDGESKDVPLPDADELILETRGQKMVLRREARPRWAHAMGRDRYGLWAAFAVGKVEQRMRWIPPGRFMMGSPEHEEGRWDDEGPQHLVTLDQGFWMAETPCTQALWKAVMGDNPSHFKSPELLMRPVESVSYENVQRFIKDLDRKLDRKVGKGFELPTEKQWEYACRAGTTAPTYAERDAVAWHRGNSDAQTHEVGLKQRNAWGLYDMLGNVFEWCADMYAPYPSRAVEEATSPSGRDRVIRGGGWADDARSVRAAYRYWLGPGARSGSLGFRLVRGQELRQAGQAGREERKGEQARAGDPPGGRPAPPQKDEGQ